MSLLNELDALNGGLDPNATTENTVIEDGGDESNIDGVVDTNDDVKSNLDAMDASLDAMAVAAEAASITYVNWANLQTNLKSIAGMTKIDKALAMETFAAIPAVPAIAVAKLTTAASSGNLDVVREVTNGINQEPPSEIVNLNDEVLSTIRNSQDANLKALDMWNNHASSIAEQFQRITKPAIIFNEEKAVNLLETKLNELYVGRVVVGYDKYSDGALAELVSNFIYKDSSLWDWVTGVGINPWEMTITELVSYLPEVTKIVEGHVGYCRSRLNSPDTIYNSYWVKDVISQLKTLKELRGVLDKENNTLSRLEELLAFID